MKRICSIFFLCLIVINTVGYYALFVIVEKQLSAPILQKIETNANELGGNLIFVIPIEVPYVQPENEYTALEGEIFYQGNVYELVKQRIHNDKLYVVCVKNEALSDARGVIADYSKLFSGQQAEHADSTIKIINSVSKFYTQENHSPKLESTGWCLMLSHKPFGESYSFENSSSVFHPPQFFI